MMESVIAGHASSDPAPPSTLRRYRRRFLAGAVAVLLVLTACSRSPDESKGGGGENGTGAQPQGSGAAEAIQSQPMAHNDGPVRVDLLAVDRGVANTVTVRFRLVNQGQEALSVGPSLKQRAAAATFTVDGVSLVDGLGNKRYFPLYSTNEECLCSDVSSATVEPNKPVDLFAVFPAPPAQVKKIMVTVPLTPPFLDVPVGDGPAQPAPGQSVDPAATSLKPPKILPVLNTVDGNEESVDEDDANQSVRLSADVLFALNKADLTPKAQAALKRVAGRIDASSGNTVKIDGHTDNTGNDAINEPLSQRRAAAVETRLKKLVTRQGVTYQSAGHGSQEPVATNDTPDGRQKNRRVTVTFARPASTQPTASAAPPPASPAPLYTGGELPVIGTAQPDQQQNLKVEINSIHRESTGLVALTWTLTNTGTEDFNSVASFPNKLYFTHYLGGGVPGITILDTATNLRYHSLRDKEGECLCTWHEFGKSILASQEKVTFFNVYKVGPEARNVSVEVPGFSAAANVPIS